MTNKISKERKALYYIGLGLMVLGFILFISTFFMFGTRSMFVHGPTSFIRRPILGMVCMIVGSVLMKVGAKGAAGSGLVLDPEKAREDLKPYSTAKGKMINDTIENIDIVKDMVNNKNRDTKEIIKIRCRNCGKLNDEDAVFCKFCGKKM